MTSTATATTMVITMMMTTTTTAKKKKKTFFINQQIIKDKERKKCPLLSEENLIHLSKKILRKFQHVDTYFNLPFPAALVSNIEISRSQK